MLFFLLFTFRHFFIPPPPKYELKLSKEMWVTLTELNKALGRIFIVIIKLFITRLIPE